MALLGAETDSEPEQSPSTTWALRQQQHKADVRAGLVLAAKDGNVSSLRSHLAVQGAVDKKVLSTALHVAVAQENLECCEVLLNSGADVDEKNFAGSTCMHVAAEAGSKEVVQLLMEFQASLNIRNQEGRCAIALANNAAVRQLIYNEVKRRAEVAEHRKRFQSNLQNKASSSKKTSPAARPSGKRSPLSPWNNGSKDVFAGQSESTDRAAVTRELLICRVCLRFFCSEPETEPICLPCGHTFCRTCISSLRGTSTRGAAPHSFRCPLDRQVFSRNLELKVNTLLQEMIPLLQLPFSTPKPSSPARHTTGCDVSLSPMSPFLQGHGLLQNDTALTRDAACSPILPEPASPTSLLAVSESTSKCVPQQVEAILSDLVTAVCQGTNAVSSKAHEVHRRSLDN